MFLLQLRDELRKLFGKKRTFIGFYFFLAVQLFIVLLFRHVPAPRERMHALLDGNGYLAEQFISALTIATVMIFPLSYLLLPLYVALVGGDLVAKESEDRTLNLVLARPVSRVRLLCLKYVAGVIFCVALVLSLGAFACLFASIWFPWGGLFAFIPDEVFTVLDSWAGLKRYALAHLVMVTKALVILSLAFMFSCFKVKPAAATVLALSVIYASAILQNIPFFREMQEWFLTYHLNAWQLVLADPVPWWKVGQSVSILAGFSLTCLVIGSASFQIRDIK